MDSLSLKLLPLEHAVLRELRKTGLAGRPVLVAASGGLDSLVMLIVLKRLQPLLKMPLYVAHIHHGRAASLDQTLFRDEARSFICEAARQLKVSFHTNKKAPPKMLKSEEAFREFRYKSLRKIAAKIAKEAGEVPLLALAHHQEDLLETQIMRLIRGTGATGLKSMLFYVEKDKKLRPLLFLQKQQILDFADQMKVRALEDPSNADCGPLRNWLRHEWLPQLEKKIPGSKASLARSLGLLARYGENSGSHKSDPKRSLNRIQFLALNRDEKLALIVKYLRVLGVRSYTQGHVEEIVRRLDTRRTDSTFTLLKHKWHINARRIQALKN